MAGEMTNPSRKEARTPPIIGAAMRFQASDPVPAALRRARNECQARAPTRPNCGNLPTARLAGNLAAGCSR